MDDTGDGRSSDTRPRSFDAKFMISVFRGELPERSRNSATRGKPWQNISQRYDKTNTRKIVSRGEFTVMSEPSRIENAVLLHGRSCVNK